ncbi:Zn finger protein [Exophiala xenobiotica]|nr:Zn finger protein [Exophiala xenobiotica]KAK5197902.1 Zn finger protein [Exophiala xenobiotica]KAK5210240.1 Zn finger protein [Exophiala xenobiotica]KAK5228545.1 Zn finger protein [Exophiala xenobiotica]KAK5238387.1 Zn finger protein [Exophiala xenobiotica]
MTANYSTQTYTIPQTQQNHFFASQQPSPASSASPNSPRMQDDLQQHAPNPYKQLRPLKSPLYVPAALRPTEHFYTPSPMTPPKSLHESLDTLDTSETQTGSPEQQQHLDLESYDPDWIQEADLGEVTGPPTKDHWKPDQASPTCDSPECRSTFNLFVRKHHCRHCGHIFCSSHTPFIIPLDQYAKFHPDGVPSRACETCHRQYQRWDTARSIQRKNSQNSKDDSNNGSGPPTPLAGPAGHRRILSGGLRGGTPTAEVANSVPKDWHWSTF